MYSSTLPSTCALDWGGWSTPRPGRFTPGKDPVPIVQKAGLAPGPEWMGEENLAPDRHSIPGPSYQISVNGINEHIAGISEMRNSSTKATT